jgi:tetratricopeptide (TPR) repeat protein
MDERALLQQLRELVAAQLVVEESEDQFSFRHALTREAVYNALLVRERKRLHQLVAETIERVRADSLDMHVANLAYHYYQAGVWDKALEYSRRAGEKDQAIYAPHAAVEHFTWALRSAEHSSMPPPPGLYHARGQAYETVGDWDRARADYEEESVAAHSARDGLVEWQSLIDLGFLWAARDYARAGDYFRLALERAREMSDPAILGRSLNRLGNWNVMIEQPAEALKAHEEALAIFRRAGDRRGVADTLDLLGLAHFLSGNPIRGAELYQEAVGLFHELGDRRGLSSSLATMCLRDWSPTHDTLVPSGVTFATVAQEGEMALQIARDIGHRSAEAFALCELGLCWAGEGNYGNALQCAQSALDIAEEISHRQWKCRTLFTLGVTYLNLFALPPAAENLAAALQLAKEMGSAHYACNVSRFLASTYILQKEYDRAEAVLAAAFPHDAPALTTAQRNVQYAWAEWALARSEPHLTLEIVGRLIASAPNASLGRVIPRLWKLRGEALVTLRQFDAGEADLRAACETATAQGTRPLLWRIHASLGKLYKAQKRREEAETEFTAARQMITQLAASASDTGLREQALAAALGTLPEPRPLSPRRAAKATFGGLTERERQVAALIAEGRSNGEIAGALVISKRTVETHVGSLMSKLGFKTRAQVVAWAIGRGLVDAEA